MLADLGNHAPIVPATQETQDTAELYLRRMSHEDYALIRDALDRDLQGRLPYSTLARLAALSATKLEAPPPPPDHKGAPRLSECVSGSVGTEKPVNQDSVTSFQLPFASCQLPVSPQASVIFMERTPGNSYVPTIRELPTRRVPQRLAAEGAGALSPAELLAIILRVGGQGENAIAMAQRLLAEFGGLVGLARATVDELSRTHGMGPAKATQIKAALELGRRMHLATPDERLKVHGPADVANLLQLEMSLLEKEEIRAVLLDTKNNVLKVTTLYHGSLNTAVVRVGEVFREAIRANAASIIVVHNHPSGDPTPSPEDVSVTESLVKAGQMVDIDVLDHVIIGRQRYVSMKEKRAGFK